MKKHPTPSPFALPMMMSELAMTSWETILRRSLMMAQGNCSAAEYHRMGAEKLAAVQSAARAWTDGRGQAAVVAPFLTRTRANVRRLRKQT